MTDTGRKRFNLRRERDETAEIITVPVGHIIPSRSSFRRSMSEQGLIRLADSIMRYGVLQPLTVRAVETVVGRRGRNEAVVYELIAGERRLKAAKMAGLSEVPCIVTVTDDRRAAELSLVENLGREGLTCFDEAAAMASLIDVYGLSQDEVAGVFGIQRSTVSAKLRLLRLTAEEKLILAAGGLTERHARAVLKICDSEKRVQVIREAARLSLNVSQTEELVDRVLCPSEEKAKARRKVSIKDPRLLLNTIDRAVETLERSGATIEREQRQTSDGIEVILRIKNPETVKTAV